MWRVVLKPKEQREHTKVSKLDVAVTTQEHVFWTKVTMDGPRFVQTFERGGKLPEHLGSHDAKRKHKAQRHVTQLHLHLLLVWDLHLHYHHWDLKL